MNANNFPHKRPTNGNRTRRVWEVADRITKELDRTAERQEVIAACVREGGNSGTASTQYHYWKLDHESKTAPKVGAGTTDFLSLQMSADGRLLIPATMREAMLMGAAGTVSARVVDGELRLVSPQVAVKRLQDYVRKADTGSGSVVDELIAERRAEAAKG